MRIATFNVQNMRLRQRDGRAVLDGARDADAIGTAGDPAFDPLDRRLTAAVIRAARADVVALQEVFDQATLDHFHDRVLRRAGAPRYPWRRCLPGNDGRGMSVAAMSRRPFRRVVSHREETAESLGLSDIPEGMREGPIFRRDCLEVAVGRVTLFIVHLKAPWPDRARARAVRAAEAQAIRALVTRSMGRPAETWWMVLGDLNEPDRGPHSALAPLLEGGFAVDLMRRVAPGQRWTYHVPGTAHYDRPDGMLASPALAAAFPTARPEILRQGLDRGAARYTGDRLIGVGPLRPHASDHAALCISFPGL